MSDARAAIVSPMPPLRLRALRRLLRPAERVYAVVLLSVVSGAYLPFFIRFTGGVQEEHTEVAHSVLLPLYAVLCGLVLLHPRSFARASARAAWAWGLVGLALISTTWSMEPDITLRRSIALGAPTALGAMLAVRFRTDELLRLLGWAIGIPAVLSAFVGLALPEIGTSTIDYGSAWRGVYGNKNSLGRAMAFGVIVLVLLAMQSRRHRWIPCCAAGLSMMLVVLSRSATSLLVVLGISALIPLFRSLRLRSAVASAVWVIAALAAIMALTILAANAESMLGVIGRDTTMTGRTTLWALAVAYMGDHPWLGHGYNAFWQGWSGSSAGLLEEVGWDTPHAHNGFLDLGLDLGAVGLVVLTLGLVATARAALRSARATDDVVGIWPLVFLCFLLLMNVTETSLLRQHNIYWILYVAVMASDLLSDARARSPARHALAAGARRATLGVRRAVRPRPMDG